MDQPSRRRLTKTLIAGKALEIIDEDGLVGLSMRRLGAALGVEGMAVYRYYPEKEAILDQVVDLVMGDLWFPDAGLSWHENLRLVARTLRERALSHPNALPLVAARRLHTPLLDKVLTAAIDDMCVQGLELDAARSIVNALMSFVLGHCWLEVGAFVGEMPDTGGLTRAPVFAPDPLLTSDWTHPRTLQFEQGLEFLLGGAKRQRK